MANIFEICDFLFVMLFLPDEQKNCVNLYCNC